MIPPDLGPLTDASQLLAFAWRGGFLIAALAGLARTAFSDYRKLRAQYGLSTYAEADIIDLIRQAGYDDVRRQPNFGHNPHRMTFKAPQSNLTRAQPASALILRSHSAGMALLSE